MTRALAAGPTSASRAGLRAGAGRLLRRARGVREAEPFTPLIDAKAAGELLGVPASWLLAQARAGRTLTTGSVTTYASAARTCATGCERTGSHPRATAALYGAAYGEADAPDRAGERSRVPTPR